MMTPKSSCQQPDWCWTCKSSSQHWRSTGGIVRLSLFLHCCVHVTETYKVHILSWCRSWKVYDNTELISWNRWSTHPRSVETTRERWSRDNLRIGISVAIVRLLTLLFLPTLMCMTWSVYVPESCSQRRLYLQSPVDPKLGRRSVN